MRISYWLSVVGLLTTLSCSSPLNEFQCTENAQCVDEQGAGVCTSGFCAFVDTVACDGLRFGKHAGDRSGQCVGAEGEIDAGLTDAGLTDAGLTDAGEGDFDAGQANPDCGNDLLDNEEECDDGNLAFGDGCSSDCLIEKTCVITHNGGSPLTLSTILVDPDGRTSARSNTTLSGNDDAEIFNTREAITACGTHVYATQRGAGVITHLESQADGSLDFRTDVLQANVYSVHCLADASTLIALSSPTDSDAKMALVAYTIASDGALTVANSLTLNFADGPHSFRNTVPTVVHPTNGDLWIISYFRNEGFIMGGLPTQFGLAFRIDVDASGNAIVEEGPTDVGASDIGFDMDIGNNGHQLTMAGLTGSCTGVWPLPSDGSLPDSDPIDQCGGVFANGQSTAARTSDSVFYQGHSSTSVRIYEVAEMGLGFVAASPTSDGGRQIELLYDDSILFTVGRTSGIVTVFTASTDGKILDEVLATTMVPATSIRSIATVWCL